MFLSGTTHFQNSLACSKSNDIHSSLSIHACHIRGKAQVLSLCAEKLNFLAIWSVQAYIRRQDRSLSSALVSQIMDVCCQCWWPLKYHESLDFPAVTITTKTSHQFSSPLEGNNIPSENSLVMSEIKRNKWLSCHLAY